MGKVTFCGACGSVTGSCSYLEWGDTGILVDCGLYQGDEELKQRNWRWFLFEPHELKAVVMTHAHLDHTGLLPRLVAKGFEGPIYCTRPSRGLISLILQDAGHLQEEQARFARKKGYSHHADPEPLYTAKDSRKAIKMLKRPELRRQTRDRAGNPRAIPSCRTSVGSRHTRDQSEGQRR